MRIAILLEDGFEDSEFRIPFDKLTASGSTLSVISNTKGKMLVGKRGHDKVTSDQSISDVSPDQFDGVVIPGGRSPEKLRKNPSMVSFVNAMNNEGKLIAAVCHGPQLLVSAGLVSGKKMTSWPAISIELKEAGANWIDQPVVIDNNIITSRKPADLEKFSEAIISRLTGSAEG